MKYNLDDKPSLGHTLLYALQWWIVILPAVVTMGLVIGKLHYGADPAAQGFYMQKLFFVLGATLLVQVLAGHRLPLVVGPASVLLIGIVASSSSSLPAIYTGVALGGVLMALVAVSGAMSYLRRVFTPRVVIVILILIPVTLGPTIVKLIFSEGSSPLFNLIFALVFCLALMGANDRLKGVWKSATLLLGISVATIVYRLFFSAAAPLPVAASHGAMPLFPGFEFDAGIILSFLCCSVALMINETGSIEAVGRMLSAGDMDRRNKRGVAITGLGNAVAGSLGVIGPIDYSSSPGIIASSGCASRYPFIPAAVMLLVCAFVPAIVGWLLRIPDVVMGTVLLYVMISQFAAAFQMTVETKAVKNFNDGSTIGVALMVAIAVSFMPAEAAALFPSFIRPILANGFVMGVITVLVCEHLIYRKKPRGVDIE